MSNPTVEELFEHLGQEVSFNVQNYFEGSWRVTPYFSEECGDAVCKASEWAESGVHKGKLRVIDRTGKEIIRFHEGGGIDRDSC